MKMFLVILSALMSLSAFAATDGSIQGRVVNLKVDNNPALSHGGNLTFVTVTIKDVCPIYPGISYTVSKVSDQVALLELSLLEHGGACGNRRADMGFVTAVDVRGELTKLGLNPDTAQVVVGVK